MSDELSMQQKGGLALKKKLGSKKAVKEHFNKLREKGLEKRLANPKKHAPSGKPKK